MDQGYGVVCDSAGTPIPGLIMVAANQEHGIIAAREASTTDVALPVGTQLRILPNHACATAAQHGGYHVVDDDHQAAYWPRFNGW